MGAVGMRPWTNATLLSELRIGGVQENEILSRLRDEISVPCDEALESFVLANVESDRLELAEKVLRVAAAAGECDFARRVAETFIERLKIEELAGIVFSAEFVSAGVIAAVAVIFRRVEVAAVRASLDECVATAVRFQNLKYGLIGDPEKQAIFAGLDNRQGVYRSLRFG
jgi:hypothetical protein